MSLDYDATLFWLIISTTLGFGCALGWLWGRGKNLYGFIFPVMLSPILPCSLIVPLGLLILMPEKCDYIDFMGDSFVVDPCTLRNLFFHHMKGIWALTAFFFLLATPIIMIWHVLYWVMIFGVRYATRKYNKAAFQE